MKKKGSSLHWVGIILVIIGFLMVFGLFPIFYCAGVSTFGICLGLNINLGFWFGIAFVIVGLVLVLRGR